MRQDAFAELSRLPEEIALLNQQKKQVRQELRATLSSYLEKIDSFSEVDETVKEYDFDELFQKIELIDEPSDDPDTEHPAEEPAGEAEDEGEKLELDLSSGNEDDDEDEKLELDLSSGDEDDDEDEEPKEDLRKKLEQGGIAYLSDDL